MTTFRFPLSMALAAMMTITVPVFAGPGGHGGSAGGGPHASAAAGMSASRDTTKDAKSNSGKHEGVKRGNKGGKTRGLNRADEVAGNHGDKGRDNAQAKQSR